MALSYDQISAITEKKFLPKMVDNIFAEIPTLGRLKKKEKKLDGGTKVIVPLNYAQATAAGWFQGADTLDTTDNEVITAAEFDWKQLYGNISITRRDELKNSGDAAVLNFVAKKMEIVEKTIRDTLATGVYNDGSDAKAIVGLRKFVTSSSTYGGLSQSTYSFWAGQTDGTTTTMSISALQSMWGDCSVGSDHPTVITATQANYNRYYALLEPMQRFADANTAKGGFTSLLFNGVPMIVDSKVPTNYVYFINEKYLDLYVHKDENFRFEKFMKPINQNVKVAKIYWMGALASNNNRMHGVLSAVAA